MSGYFTHAEVEETTPDTVINGTWAGRIVDAPADMTKPVTVRIPGFNPDIVFGPCPWTPRDADTLPARGDRCLVAFDDQLNGWVLSWIPS